MIKFDKNKKLGDKRKTGEANLRAKSETKWRRNFPKRGKGN